MITIGVDFSKKSAVYDVLDDSGQRIKRCKLENRPEYIVEFLDQWPGPKQLAMEATRNWGLYYETVKDHVDHFYLGHPRKMKAITESENKNDKRDAEMIARLTHSGFLPHAYVSSLDIRQLRSLLRFRGFLVNQRKALRNQVQILVDRNRWPHQRPTAFKNIFCLRGLKWLYSLELLPRERFILDRLLQTYEQLNQQIQTIENFIETQSCEMPDLEYLRRIPGFRKSKINAYVVLLEIADIQRFRKARHLAHYAGLVPSEYSSGDLHRTGRLVKGANMLLRTALIESTFAAIRADRGLREYYQSVKNRRNASSATIACARKLSYAVYHVLKHKVDYQPFNPPVTANVSYAVSEKR